MNRSLLRPAGALIVAAVLALVAAQPAEAGRCHKARRCGARHHCCHKAHHSRCHKQCCHTQCCQSSCASSCCTTVSYAAPACSSCQDGGMIIAPEAAPADAAPAPTEAAPDAPAPPEAAEDVPAPEQPYAPEPAAEDAPAAPAPAEEAAPAEAPAEAK